MSYATPVTTYRFYQTRKYRLPLSKGYDLEKIERMERREYERALAHEQARVEDTQRFYQPTRRHQIFLAFPAKDYANPVTRMSIIEAVVNCNQK